MTEQLPKPLGMRAYGSIPHLPGSRRGPGDRGLEAAQAMILTDQARDRYDTVIVQVKLDGSNVAAALLDGEIVPLVRAGYVATQSPFEQHHLWAEYVRANAKKFRKILCDGEWISGEWLAQAHGTIYDLTGRSPFVAFDIWEREPERGREVRRLPFSALYERGVHWYFATPPVVHVGGPLGIVEAMRRVDQRLYGEVDAPEGAVWRVERLHKNRVIVDFLGKYVRPGKADGCYLKNEHGQLVPTWNWRPE